MPAPTSSTIAQANEYHFNLVKRNLKTQSEKAREFVPILKEFVILVTDPDSRVGSRRGGLVIMF